VSTRLLLPCLALLAVRLAAPAAESAAPAALVFDAGKVAPVRLLKHEFAFTNPGPAALVITGVVSSCSCLKAAAWTREVPPGGRGTVAVEWLTAGFPGPQEETLTLQPGDPARPGPVLTVRGQVWLPVEARPPAVTLPAGTEAVVQITNHLAAPVTLRPPAAGPAAFTAELRTNIPGHAYELRLRAAAPAPAGHVFAKVTLATSLPELPQVEVNVFIPAGRR
jgi:hypothetical protein